MKVARTQKTEDLRKTIPSQQKPSSHRVSMLDNRPESAAQRKVQSQIQNSPVVLAQQTQLKGLSSGGTLKETREGEGLIQGKFVTQQVSMDEEEFT